MVLLVRRREGRRRTPTARTNEGVVGDSHETGKVEDTKTSRRRQGRVPLTKGVEGSEGVTDGADGDDLHWKRRDLWVS